MLHKQMAVQMLDLVAEGSGRQALALHLEPVAIPVLGPDPDHVRPGDDAPFAGHAEAALQPGLLAALSHDLRVHQFDILLRVLVQHHAHPAQHSHLGSSQPSAIGILQCFQHIVQQLVQVRVELRHRAAHLCQALLSLHHDLP